MIRPTVIRTPSTIACLLLLFPSCRDASAQSWSSPPARTNLSFSWSVYDPVDAISSQIHGQADLIRAQGDAAVRFAEARKLRAEAYSKELDNWVKQLRAHWKRRILREQQSLEYHRLRQVKKLRYLNDRKWSNSRVWDKLRNHPRLAAGRIEQGDALNFLLERLQVTTLSYDYESTASRFSGDVIQALTLDPAWFGDLNLKQGGFVFGAMQGIRDKIEYWPYLLRWEEFELARASFERARQAVLAESEQNGKATVESLERMQSALFALAQDFYASQNVRQWVRRYKRYSQFTNTERFLQRLDREVARCQETGDVRSLRMATGYNPGEMGQNLLAFLCFMNRNGIEFAPATPGKEAAYHRMFIMMRSLYLTVEESDLSIQPVDLRKSAK